MSVCLHVYLCTTCGPGAQGTQKRASDRLKLKLQMVVTHHVGAGNQTETSACVLTVELSLQSLGRFSVTGSSPLNAMGLCKLSHLDLALADKICLEINSFLLDFDFGGM